MTNQVNDQIEILRRIADTGLNGSESTANSDLWLHMSDEIQHLKTMYDTLSCTTIREFTDLSVKEKRQKYLDPK